MIGSYTVLSTVSFKSLFNYLGRCLVDVIGQHDNKLISPYACQQAMRSHKYLKTLCHFDQRIVFFMVTVLIVQWLKAVQINEQQCEVGRRALVVPGSPCR